MPPWLDGEQEPTLLVTADQVVSYRGTIREKPTSQEQCREFLKSYADEPAVTVSSLVVTNTATRRQAVVRSTQRGEVTLGVSLVSPLLFGLHAVGLGCGVQGTDIAKQYFLPLPEHVIDQLVADPLMMSTAGAFRIESGSVPLREPRILLQPRAHRRPTSTRHMRPCRGNEAVPWAPRGRRELHLGSTAAAALPAAGRSTGWHASRRRCRRARVRLMLDVQQSSCFTRDTVQMRRTGYKYSSNSPWPVAMACACASRWPTRPFRQIEQRKENLARSVNLCCW